MQGHNLRTVKRHNEPKLTLTCVLCIKKTLCKILKSFGQVKLKLKHETQIFASLQLIKGNNSRKKRKKVQVQNQNWSAFVCSLCINSNDLYEMK
jgi:hypothetical protein